MKTNIFVNLFLYGLIFSTSCSQKNDTRIARGFIGVLPAQSKYALLQNFKNAQIDKNQLFLDFNGNPCLCIDSLVVLLSGKSDSILTFPLSISPNQICCFNDGSIFFLQDSLWS